MPYEKENLNIMAHDGNENQLQYHFTLVRLAAIKKTENNHVSDHVQQREPFHTVGM